MQSLVDIYTYPCSTSTSLPPTSTSPIFGAAGGGVAGGGAVVVENVAARRMAADVLDDEPAVIRERGIVVAALNEPSIVVTVFWKCQIDC